MKKMIIFLAILLTLSVPAIGQDTVTLTDDNLDIGSIDYDLDKQELSFFDRLRLELKPFTVIDGATCSRNPDRSRSWTPPFPTTFAVCYKNTDHIGVAWQVFQTDPGPRKFLTEIQIGEGETKCWEDLEYPNQYHFDYYYCDEVSQNECSDTDGGIDYFEKGKVTFTQAGQTERWSDICDGTQRVLERYCDSDNTPASKGKSCQNGCIDGACQSTAPGGSGDGDDNTDEFDPFWLLVGFAAILTIGGLGVLFKGRRRR